MPSTFMPSTDFHFPAPERDRLARVASRPRLQSGASAFLLVFSLLALLVATVVPVLADTCSYNYNCGSSSTCASVMGGSSGTRSQAGVTKDQCEKARLETIPGGSSPCTCTTGGAAATSSTGGAMISNTGNFQQDLLTNSVNLAIVSRTTNPVVSSFMQGAATGFISSMFANNAEAQRQAALMAQAIQRRNQELAEQNRIAQQQRMDAMFARLNSELKLEGVPLALGLKGMNSASPDSLQLKGLASSGPADLQLKIGPSSATSYGLKGLPGIYVGGPAGNDAPAANPNLVSGPGTGTTGLGIAGLPGIYLDGVQPSQAPQLAQAAENLNGPERAIAQDGALQKAETNPQLTNISHDPQIQNFQQADQDYQQALTANAKASQELQAAQSHVEADKSAVEIAQSQLAAITPSVQQQEAFQGMIAASKTDEQAWQLAGANFDSTQVHLSASRERAALALAQTTPTTSTPVDLTHAAQSTPALLRTPANTGVPAAAVSTARLSPPRPALVTVARAELPPSNPRVAELCAQLSGAQSALRRLMETQTMHNETREEWEKTVDDASDDAWKRGRDMLREYSGEKLSEHLNGLIEQSDREIEKLYRDISKEKDPSKVGALQKRWEELDQHKAALQDAVRRAATDQKHLDELTDLREFSEWAPKYNGDLVGTMDGIRQVVDIVATEPWIKYSLSIEDSGYDIMQEVLGAQAIRQLNQNSDQFLAAQKSLHARIQSTVAKLQKYRRDTPPGTASCQ